MIYIYIIMNSVLFFLSALSCGVALDTISIDTKLGIVRGVTERVHMLDKESSVIKFLGIPYAEPPVGEYRFAKPRHKKPFDEPVDGLKHGNACLQPNIGMQPSGDITYDEDCLNLNIYTPNVALNDKPLAVMIWIHGGAFVVGSSDLYIGSHLAAYGGVVVVTINYRLSVWGFLSTEDDTSPGNYGLWDQRMAIEWVHDNIAAFGGDPNSVTIFGESAGAASVVFQALYPKNAGLFQRVIAQSGSAGAWWPSNDENSRQNAEKLAKYAGCETSNTSSMVICLKEKSAEELMNIVDDFDNGFTAVPMPFLPTMDKEFITTKARDTFVDNIDLLEDVNEFYQSLDLMIGTNSGEGSLSVSPFFGVSNPENFMPNSQDFEQKLVPVVSKLAYPDVNSPIIADAIIAEYSNHVKPDDPITIREEFLAMHADFIFTDPLYRTLNFHSNSVRGNFMYHFDDTTSNHLFCHMSWFQSVGHGDEIPFVFGYKNSDVLDDWQFEPAEGEEKLSKQVISLWSNFAKTGNPNQPVPVGLDWLPYTKKHQHYLQISRGMTSSNVKQHLNTKRADFWAKTLPNLVERIVKSQQGINDDETCERNEEC